MPSTWRSEPANLQGYSICGIIPPTWPWLDVYTVEKVTAAKCMETFEKLLNAAKKPWNLQKSPLYRHVKPSEKIDDMGTMLIPRLISEIEESGLPEYEFLRNAPEYPEFIERLKSKLL